jgi:hypothetical protein
MAVPANIGNPFSRCLAAKLTRTPEGGEGFVAALAVGGGDKKPSTVKRTPHGRPIDDAVGGRVGAEKEPAPTEVGAGVVPARGAVQA